MGGINQFGHACEDEGDLEWTPRSLPLRNARLWMGTFGTQQAALAVFEFTQWEVGADLLVQHGLIRPSERLHGRPIRADQSPSGRHALKSCFSRLHMSTSSLAEALRQIADFSFPRVNPLRVETQHSLDLFVPLARPICEFFHADCDRLTPSFVIKEVVPLVVGQVNVRSQTNDVISRQCDSTHLRYRCSSTSVPLGGTAMPYGVGTLVTV